MTLVKICGLTREQDVDAAIAAGADMVGFVLVPDSPATSSSTAPRRWQPASRRACRPSQRRATGGQSPTVGDSPRF